MAVLRSLAVSLLALARPVAAGGECQACAKTLALLEESLQSQDLDAIASAYTEDALIMAVNHEDADRREFLGTAGAREFHKERFMRFEHKPVAKAIEGFDKAADKLTRLTGWTMWKSSTDTYNYDFNVDTLVMNSEGQIQHHNVFFRGRPGPAGAPAPVGVPHARDLVSKPLYTKPWDRHNAAFGSMNLSAIVADYADDAHIYTVNRATKEHLHYHGKDGVQRFFTEMFARVTGDDGSNVLVMDDSFEKVGPEMDYNTAFLAWKSHSPSYDYNFGGDSMVEDDSGKFSVQLIYFDGVAKTSLI